MAFNKAARRRKIHKRIRKNVKGTSARPRLNVFRSNTDIYGQLIDDVAGKTLLSISTKTQGLDCTGNRVEQAKTVGKALAEKAQDLSIEGVVFDRGGYLYHGRVKAFADGAREGGLKF